MSLESTGEYVCKAETSSWQYMQSAWLEVYPGKAAISFLLDLVNDVVWLARSSLMIFGVCFVFLVEELLSHSLMPNTPPEMAEGKKPC